MKKFLKLFLCVLAVTAALTFSACSPPDAEVNDDYKTYRKGYSSMEAIASLSVTTTDETAANLLAQDVLNVLTEIDESLSATNANSSISRFNAAEAGATVEIDKTAYTVLNLALDMYEMTEGFYNPAVYYSVQAYGFGGAKSKPQSAADLPADQLIAKYTALSTHFAEIELKEENGAYYAVKPTATVEVDGNIYSLKIDLGGIGKGYAVDMVNALMGEYGFEYGSFNFGDSSLSCRSSYNNSDGKFLLGFINPRGANTYMNARIANTCLSTSGDYVQYYFINGVRYCHIIDPFTGKPVQTGIMSATVLGGSAAENDALTTAIMAMGVEKAQTFIAEKLTDRKVLFTYDGNNLFITLESSEYEITDNSFLHNLDGNMIALIVVSALIVISAVAAVAVYFNYKKKNGGDSNVA